MRSPALLLGLLSVLLLVACSSSEERAERAREEARQALMRGDRSAALQALNQLRETRADTPEALLQLAQLLVAAGEAPEVLWLLEDGVRRFPESDGLRLALGRVALMVGNPSAVRAAVEPIAAASDQHAAALVLLAQAELRLGNLERGLEILAQAERLYPERPEARLARIATLLTERRVEEARSALDEAKESLESAEQGQEALRRLEISYYTLQAHQGESDAAIAGLRALVDADPSDPQAWQALVQALWRGGRVEEGRDLVRAAIENDPDHLGLYPLVSPLHAALGQEEEAEAALREFAQRSQSPTGYVLLAQFYMARQDEERVLDLFEEALAVFPDDRMLRKFHAETLIWFERGEEAQAEFERFRQAFPDDPHAEYLQARLELAEGNPGAAAERLRRLMPRLDQAATQFWLGQALETLGDRAGAERRYALALARNPADLALYTPLIRLAEQRGDWRGVAGTAQVMVRRAPGLFDAWAALITALVNLGEGEAAERLARRCVQIFPDRPEAGLLLARSLRAKRDYEAALQELARVNERFGSTPELDAERVFTLGLAGRVGEGVTEARKVLATSPDSPQVHVALAALLFQLGQAEEGARAVDRALELDPDDPAPLKISDCERYLALRPDDPTVHFILGAVHANAGRPDPAIASYRRAAELDAAAFAPRNNLAELLADRDLEAALAAAQEAYALASKNTHVLDTLGWLYLKKGLAERAISLLEEAHDGAPERTDPQLHLALAYREVGRTEDARRLLSELQGRVEGADRARVDEALRSVQ
jgi:tetratricopeptide (TPR) repeat protein